MGDYHKGGGTDGVSSVNAHLAASAPLPKPDDGPDWGDPERATQSSTPAAPSSPNAHGTQAFIDGSSLGTAKYVGR
jgi:hypothetical protein